MEQIRDLRIMHVLSPVKWDGSTFNANADANWKVAKKTIDFLPNCHHYILVPLEHNIKIDSDNVTFVKYNYPKSVQLNRGMFDYRQIRFDFTRLDVDFVFNHQPELTFNIHQWFSTNRYYESPKYFGFYHWVDCNKSRGSQGGTPTFYMRQLESMHILDANFIHSDLSLEYMKSNFKDFDTTHLHSNIYEMPLSSKIEAEGTPFDLPNKKILLFNHRWNKSSGIKRLIEYIDGLSDEYLVWITDDKNCDYNGSANVRIKSLQYSDYAYLLENVYASLCFIDGYSTWNLSAQDSLVKGKPILCYDHKTLRRVIGEDYKGYFTTKEQFNQLLENLPSVEGNITAEHDFIFELQLKTAMRDLWKDTVNEPKDAQGWINAIKSGVVDKKGIAHKVNPKIRLNNTGHFIRRNLLHNGIRDNIKSPYTQYFIEGDEKTIVRDLFNS
jgi:hypothetical protein